MIWNYKKTPGKVSLFFGFELGFERSENLAFERSENEFFLVLILIEITTFFFHVCFHGSNH